MSASNPQVSLIRRKDTKDKGADDSSPNSVYRDCFPGDSLDISRQWQCVVTTKRPYLSTTRQSNTLSHAKLNDKHDTPDCQSTVFTESECVHTSHGLTIRRSKVRIDIRAHAGHDNNDTEPTEKSSTGNCSYDGTWDSCGCVGCFF
jgi:hypothetical protein